VILHVLERRIVEALAQAALELLARELHVALTFSHLYGHAGSSQTSR
jgi:hypothetical protein